MTFRSSFARLLLVLAMLFSTVAAGAAAQSVEGDDGPDIRLRTGDTQITDGLAEASALDQRGRGSYLVQFSGPITQAQADSLRALGADLVSYVPDYAYKASMTAGQAAHAANVAGVASIGVYNADYKLSPGLALSGLYRIRLDRGADASQVTTDIEAAGGSVVAGSGRVLTVMAESAHLNDIAALHAVAWVENLVLREKHNEYGAGVILGANVANASGYDGSTQIVAVADTGIGGGTAASVHADVPSSRVVDIFDWPGVSVRGCYRVTPDGAIDVDSGHGTHTALSVLGGGNAAGIGQGTAPAAGLVFQATEDWASFRGACSGEIDGYYLLGLPDDLNDLLQQAYDVGARIHSDSWGSSVAGEYTIDSAQVDNFMWLNQDFLMTTSAGNAGIDADANGFVDTDSMGSPATAKNVLTVGASENDRQGDWSCDAGIGNDCTGQNDLFTYGDAWPADYPAAPTATDPSAGNAEQLAAFSSRGPTDDGRIKPDIVAPGTWVLSGYSDLYQEGYDGVTNPQNGAFQYDGWGFPVDSEYKYMGGTSMSNPLAAGATAVVRDYYNKAHGHDASGALAKATLINSAVDLLDENNDGANDNDYPIPNSHEGWGRIDLANAVDGSAEFVDDASGITTGATNTYGFEADGTGSMRVSLVWADYPSTETAAVNLVNDLDLTVTAPDGTSYTGNVFSGGWSTTGGTADRLNNVENVYVSAAGAGTWTVEVTGFNVPFGPQPFALVVDGGGSTGGGNVAPTAAFTSSCTDLDCDFTDTSSDSDGSVVGWDWDFGDGNTSTAQNPAHSYAAAGTYTVALTVTDDDGDTGTTSASVTVTEPGGGVSMHVSDLDAVAVNEGRAWMAVVSITVVDDAGSVVAGATVDISWRDGTTDSCTTGADGICSVEDGALRKRTWSMTVTGVSHGSLTYDAGANTDPDGDSDGTTILLSRP